MESLLLYVTVSYTTVKVLLPLSSGITKYFTVLFKSFTVCSVHELLSVAVHVLEDDRESIINTSFM